MCPAHGVPVLVVDDDSLVCTTIARALTFEGYSVTALTSGEAAVAHLRAHVVDAMVLDLRIPDLRGDIVFELAVSLQSHLKARTVFLTGDVSERASPLIEACNCPMLQKPVDVDRLVAAVEAVLPRAGP